MLPKYFASICILLLPALTVGRSLVGLPRPDLSVRDDQKIETVDHDSIPCDPHRYPNLDEKDTLETIIAQHFAVAINNEKGCAPYPAVTKDGKISGGLKYSGDDNGDCEETMQVYARYKYLDATNTTLVVMQAFYEPKGTAWDSTKNKVVRGRSTWMTVITTIDVSGEMAQGKWVAMTGAKDGWNKYDWKKLKHDEIINNNLKVKQVYNGDQLVLEKTGQRAWTPHWVSAEWLTPEQIKVFNTHTWLNGRKAPFSDDEFPKLIASATAQAFTNM